MKNNVKYLTIIALLLAVVACGKTEEPYLYISFPSVSVDAAGGPVELSVSSNAGWSASCDAAWLSVSPLSGQGSGNVTVTAAENTGELRTGHVTFSWAGDPAVLTVQQRAGVTEPEKGVVSIQSVRDRYTGSPAKITDNISIEGTVISNYHRDGLDNNTSAKSIVISDGTTGIMLYCNEENSKYAFGDKVSVSLLNQTVDSYENGPVQINGIPLSSITRTGTAEVEAKEISAAEFMTGKYESVYVAVKDVQVSAADMGKTFVVNGNHTSIVMEGKDGEFFDIFTGKWASFGAEKVPTGSGTLKGIGSKYGERMQIVIARKGDYDGLTGARFEGAASLSLFYSDYTYRGDKGAYTIQVLGNVDWTASCDNPAFTVSPASGKGAANVTLSFGDNPSTTDRRVAKVTFKAVSASVADVVFTFTQLPFQPLVSDAVPVRMELPAVKAQDSVVFITHEFESEGKPVHNYSIYYDTRYKVSHWVAYPLYTDMLSGVSRTDEWEYDPKVPQRDQARMYKALTGYSRGHQLPSADRLKNTEANNQTFYFTNITPQIEDLNSGMWENLEKKLREVARSCDTVYVVTGCVVATEAEPAVKYIQDNDGSPIAVPKAYYKVCLKYKAGGSKNSGYSAIGFWMENKGLDGGLSTCAKSVADIEKLTGFDFFHNLDDKIEKAVESEWTVSEWNL